MLTHFLSIFKRSVSRSRLHPVIFRTQTHSYCNSQMQTRSYNLYEWSSGGCRCHKRIVSESTE